MYITTTMCDGVLHCLWFVFNVFLCPCMAINVNVQYNGGLLPDIMLLLLLIHTFSVLSLQLKKLQ